MIRRIPQAWVLCLSAILALTGRAEEDPLDLVGTVERTTFELGERVRAGVVLAVLHALNARKAEFGLGCRRGRLRPGSPAGG